VSGASAGLSTAAAKTEFTRAAPAGRHYDRPVTTPSADGLYDSARAFASSALQAYADEAHQRVALYAGKALEHITKACLAQHSPALLVEMKPTNSNSLIRLLGLPEGKPASFIRTVGLREALILGKAFVTSRADDTALNELADLRNGVAHAAGGDGVGERVIVAFNTLTPASPTWAKTAPTSGATTSRWWTRCSPRSATRSPTALR
jgi:hypothetical protein